MSDKKKISIWSIWVIIVLVALPFMVGAGCDAQPSPGAPNDTNSKKDISAFTLSYAAISITAGAVGSSSPSWKNQGTGIVPTASYTLKKGADAPPASVRIDSSTGAIDVATTAETTASGTYTITATGTGEYKGTKTLDLVITINPKVDISGFTLSYAAISITAGTAKSSSPTWENQGTGIVPTANYTLKKGADAPPAGVRIDSSTGAIDVATTVATTASGTYTITATGAGEYAGTKTLDLVITINPKAICITAYVPNNKAELYAHVRKLFTECNGNAADYSIINTKNITDMSYLFASDHALDGTLTTDVRPENKTFNGDISSWNTASVTNMKHMFSTAIAFNQPIGGWNTASVTSMERMFDAATAFNQPIGNWDTGKVINMSTMFNGASAFNRDIGSWDTSKVTDMSFLFAGATAFNRNIGSWDTSKVTDMRFMFNYAEVFNQDISGWSDAAKPNTVFMFRGAGAMQDGNKASWMP